MSKQYFAKYIGIPKKLFLCSIEAYQDNEEKSLKDFIVGEISSDATWVKEGDEFDVNEVIGWNKKLGINQRMDIQPNKYTDFIKIKCPTCKIFH